MRRLGVLVSAVLIVAVLVVLAGCGGSPSASPPSTSPPPSTPTPTAPPMPDAAHKSTNAGAIRFAEYYVEALNYAAQSGDLDPLHALGLRGCDSCRSVESGIRSIYQANGTVHGGRWTIRHADIPDGGVYRHGRTVDVVVRFGPQDITYPSPQKSKHYDGGATVVTFILRFSNGWHVEQWTRAA